MSKLIFCEIEYCICGICAKIQYRKVNRKLKEVLNSMKECKLAAQKLHRDRNSFEKMLDNPYLYLVFCNCKNIKIYVNFGKSGCTLCLIYVLLQWSMAAES